MRHSYISFTGPGLAGASIATDDASGPPPSARQLHPACEPLECTMNGPFFMPSPDTLTVVAVNTLRGSTDDGKTWSLPGPAIAPGMNLSHPGHTGGCLLTREGTIVIWYLDLAHRNFAWDNEKGAPKPGCRLETWVVRSTDGGKTWCDNQRLLGGYNADSMGFIQTRNGGLVLALEHLVPELRRWVVCSFLSSDQGCTWRQSNLIDLGGHGHHDGAIEPMLVELTDGRLMMLIRTNHDQFWKAFSDDGGRHWRVLQPSGIPASSAPGWLGRLADGRLALVWNRDKPEGAESWPKTNWAGPATEFPASWFREELSLAFSEDDGETWTPPVVVAREPGAQLAYPYFIERRPGELWVFTRYTFFKGSKPAPPVAVRIRVTDIAPAWF